jgi:hypothetical protein
MRLLLLLTFFTSLIFANVGVVSAFKGDANILRDGKDINVKTGLKLQKNDELTTKKNTKVQLVFKDKTIITVGKNSKFSIHDYLFDEQASTGKKVNAKFGFAKGLFRTVTGKIGKINPNKFKIKVKSASIGIRGTKFDVSVTPKATKIGVSEGAIGFTQGGVETPVAAGQIMEYTVDTGGIEVKEGVLEESKQMDKEEKEEKKEDKAEKKEDKAEKKEDKAEKKEEQKENKVAKKEEQKETTQKKEATSQDQKATPTKTKPSQEEPTLAEPTEPDGEPVEAPETGIDINKVIEVVKKVEEKKKENTVVKKEAAPEEVTESAKSAETVQEVETKTGKTIEEATNIVNSGGTVQDLSKAINPTTTLPIGNTVDAPDSVLSGIDSSKYERIAITAGYASYGYWREKTNHDNIVSIDATGTLTPEAYVNSLIGELEQKASYSGGVTSVITNASGVSSLVENGSINLEVDFKQQSFSGNIDVNSDWQATIQSGAVTSRGFSSTDIISSSTTSGVQGISGNIDGKFYGATTSGPPPNVGGGFNLNSTSDGSVKGVFGATTSH